MATAASYKLNGLIIFYMREYDYTRKQAIDSIIADLKDIDKTPISQPAIGKSSTPSPWQKG